MKPSDVKGTGKGGRVTKEDVEKHVKGQQSKPPAAAARAAVSAAASFMGDRDQKRVPMTRLRKRIAERLLKPRTTRQC